jgi:hypothetical protein
MKCPKCQKESSSESECNFCGVVFDKHQKRVQRAANPGVQQSSSEKLRINPEKAVPQKPLTVQRRPKNDPEPGVRKRDVKTLMVLGRLTRMIVDPYFLLLSFIAGFFVYAFLGITGILIKVPMFLQILLFFIAFILVAAFRLDRQGLMRDLSIDEGAVRLAVDTIEQYNRAVLAEKGENYFKAAELYEKVLVHDASNIQARFNLARIYVGKLDDLNNGLMQLQILAKTAPKGHPYYEYAVDEMRNMRKVE